MDPLSGVASVIAVIQIAKTVGTTLSKYYQTVKHARDEIRQLYHTVKNLQSLLERIKVLPPDSLHRNPKLLLNDTSCQPGNSSSLSDDASPLELFRFELNELSKALEHCSTRPTHIKTLERLKWPFTKTDLQKIEQKIDKRKDELMSEFLIENLHTSIHNFDIIRDLKKEIVIAQNEARRSKIISWLAHSLPDPSTEYHIARQKHQQGTGSWFIDGHEFKTWADTKESFMWLCGGAGAGKSILCSTAINHIQQRCKKLPSVAVSYWYITYNNPDTQNATKIVRSWIRDICSNSLDMRAKFFDTYVLCNHGQQQPTEEQVMDMLKCIMGGFDDIYLIVDGLDEFPKADRKVLLDIIKEVHQWKLSCTHIITSSRREDDINHSFQSLEKCGGFFQNMMLHYSDTKNDITDFVVKNIGSFEGKHWTPELRSEVAHSIARQANGMFRLAALQVDSLKNLRSKRQIQAKLMQLPSSLDSFYERALKDIVESDQGYVKRALQWILNVWFRASQWTGKRSLCGDC